MLQNNYPEIFGNEFVLENLIMRASGDNYAIISVCDSNSQAHAILNKWRKEHNKKKRKEKSWLDWLLRK